ncbi:MAG: AAA family ATPase [Thermoplasmata archaeon]|nr:AAA family ATPase [Thermoplasmata archaeon]
MIKEKVKTGVPGLDEMLEGGLIPARAYIVSGTTGSGKTTLAMQFLLEGVRQGERVVYVCLDAPPNEIKSDMRSYGWDIGRIQVFDATPDIMSYDKTPVRDVSTERRVIYFKDVPDTIRLTSERSPVDMTINTIQEILKQEMKERRYTRVVIDSLTSLRYFYIRTSEENSSMMSFLRLLSDLEVTSLLTLHLPEVSKPEVEVHVARGEIRLHKWIDGRGLVRGITIEKYRGSSHDHRLRFMRITPEGIVVKPVAPEKPAKRVVGELEGEEMEEQQPPQEHSSAQPPEAAPPPSDPEDIPPPPTDMPDHGGDGI